jgi:1-acyl-sn-glycerol-3-phosphate acyltransferase
MKMIVVIRTTAFVVTWLVILVTLLVLSPLNLLNGVLRRRGWKNAELPSARVLPFVGSAALWVCSVDTTVKASAASRAALRDGSTVLMYTHSSNMDPLLVQVLSGAAAKFVYKKQLMYVPFLGWVLYLYRFIAINRSNRAEAIAALDGAVVAMKEKRQSIAISPEGTRSKTGELLPFKSGPFHLAVKSQVDVVPVVIHGAHELMPPHTTVYGAGSVVFSVLAPIAVAGHTSDTLSVAVRDAMVAEQTKLRKAYPRPPPRAPVVRPVVVLVTFAAACAAMFM